MKGQHGSFRPEFKKKNPLEERRNRARRELKGLAPGKEGGRKSWKHKLKTAAILFVIFCFVRLVMIGTGVTFFGVPYLDPILSRLINQSRQFIYETYGYY